MQIRLYFTIEKSIAEDCYGRLEQMLEEQAYPLALVALEESNLAELSVYAPEDQEKALRAEISAALAVAPEQIHRETLPDIDWVKYSLEGLQPIEAGSFCIHGSHNAQDIKAGAIPLQIDAGQAFGTGHHGTTIGCLGLIEKIIAQENIACALDVGTGSGILAIAIAKLSSIPILATDIDPVATKVAEENALINGVAKNITAITAAGLNDSKIKQYSPYDLIVANILAHPLIELAPEIPLYLSERGSVVLSGLLESQKEKVLKAYEAQGLFLKDCIHDNGWVSLHLKKQIL